MKNNRSNKKPVVIITAGPTREHIDPVRFISNASSGRTGYEIAAAASADGAKVFLISGPVCIKPPGKVKICYVDTALDMKNTIEGLIRKADIFISAAAVGDWRPAVYSSKKIKKGGSLTIKLVKNPDILKNISRRYGRRKTMAGFALETEDIVQNAIKKLREKQLDLIIANPAGNIAGDKASGELLFSGGRKITVNVVSKKRFASIIWKETRAIYESKRKQQ